MATFEYEVADRAGALSRGRAEADNASDLILRFREQGRVVLAIRPAVASRDLLAGLSLGPISDAFRETLKRLSSGVNLATMVIDAPLSSKRARQARTVPGVTSLRARHPMVGWMYFLLSHR